MCNLRTDPGAAEPRAGRAAGRGDARSARLFWFALFFMVNVLHGPNCGGMSHSKAFGVERAGRGGGPEALGASLAKTSTGT